MKTSLIAHLGALIILTGMLSAPAALAQQMAFPESTTWSISEPTNVGGTVLQPGTYRIAVVPRDNGRQVVRVTNDDKTTTYTTILTVPHHLEPNEKMPTSMFVFYPAAEGQPRALRTWFPANPTGRAGHDIVYDEDRATMLARLARAPVVFYEEVEENFDLGDTELRIVTPDLRVETYVVPEFTTTVTERPVMIAERRTELPATGSKTPLLALLGLLSVAAAFAIRAVNR